MREYVSSLRHAAGGAVNLARMMGVATVTVNSWCTGKRAPRGVHLERLDTLGRMLIHSPALFNALVPGKRTMPKLPPAPPRVKAVRWDDDYWHARTVTRDERDAGELARVVDSPEVLNAMTEAEEREYLASLRDYERRTERIKPD